MAREELMSIGELSARSGVGVSTLRAWERRYGLLRPARTPGGHRRYGPADLARVMRVRRLVDRGLTVAVAAKRARSVSGQSRGTVGGLDAETVHRLVARIWVAVDALDRGSVSSQLRDLFDLHPVADALDAVILPVLHRLGAEWRASPRNIAREHAASMLVRSHLIATMRKTSDAPTCLAACPDGELHDLGTVMAAATMHAGGWNPIVLGASTPWPSAAMVIEQMRPAVVLVGATHRPVADRFLGQASVPPDTLVVLGGPGFEDGDRQRLPRAMTHHTGYGDLISAIDVALAG